MSLIEKKSDNVVAVVKVFTILEALVGKRSVSLGELAEMTSTSKATAHRILNTMADLGYVEQNADNDFYSLTLRLFCIGARSLNERIDLIKIADQAMNKICRTTGEAVNLGILDPNDNSVLYIHKYDSSYNLSMNSTLGRRNPLHSTSLGKALLAWKSPDEQDYILGQLSYDPLTENTVTDATTLRQHLDRTKQNGFAEEIEESELGVRCMAVPIFDHLGRVIAAISVGFPLFRFVDEKKLKILDLMKKQAMDASVALGFKP